MPEPNDKSTPKTNVVTIEEKDYSADDVKNLIDQQASATQKTQAAAPIIQAAEKYGITTEQLLSQAEGAFASIATAIDEGVMDQQGTIIKKEPVEEPEPEPKPVIPDPTEDKVQNAISKAMEPLQTKVDTLEKDNTKLIRLNLESQIRKEYSTTEFSQDDMTKILVNASRDSSKNLFDHAKDFVAGKEGVVSDLRKKHAAEFGIDLDKFDEANKLKTQNADGGASVFAKNKKLSFKKEEGAVSPMEATKAFISAQNQQ